MTRVYHRMMVYQAAALLLAVTVPSTAVQLFEDPEGALQAHRTGHAETGAETDNSAKTDANGQGHGATVPRRHVPDNPLANVTQKVMSDLNRSPVWNRVGPCRHGRSLLAPWLPHSACASYDCLQCKSGIFMLETLEVHRQMLPTARNVCTKPSGGQTSGADEEPLVSFVWTVHNNAPMAAESLLCVFRTAHEVPSSEFVLYDDGSTEDMSALASLVELLRSEFGTRIVTPRTSKGGAQGYLQANNEALRLATGRYAVLLNTDVCPLPGWLGVLMGTLERFPGAGMVGPMMLSPEGRVTEAGNTVFKEGRPTHRWPWAEPSEVPFLHATTSDYVSAACVLFKRELFLSLGLFDPQFSPAYYEDTDAALSMRAAGYLTVVQPLSVVIHAEGSSYTTQYKESRMAVNRGKFSEKHKALLQDHCPDPQNLCEKGAEKRAVIYDTFARQSAQVLILDWQIPEPDRDSGSLRMQELMHIIFDLGYGISFEPQYASSLARYTLPLLALGVNVMQPGTLQAMENKVTMWMGRGAKQPPCPWAVVMISRSSSFQAQMGFVRKLCPHVPVIYDTVDLHHVRERRMVEVARSTGDHTRIKLLSAYYDPVSTPEDELEFVLQTSEEKEVGYWNKSDVVLVVSTEEFRIASEKVGADKVRLLSNIYPSPNRSKGDTVDGRHGGLFVGSLCHAPNVDASKFIMKDIFGPKVHDSFPPGFMHFVWSGVTKCWNQAQLLINEAQEHPLITVHLDVSDEELEDIHMKAQFFLGALREGAGVKGKQCEALLYGLPIIGSETATEGMSMVNGTNVLVAATLEDYWTQIRRITTDASLWNKLRSNGFDLVQTQFGRDKARSMLEETLGRLGGPPRVSPAGGAPRRASGPWACPTAAPRMSDGSETHTGSEERTWSLCPYAEDSLAPLILPTALLQDRMFRDEAEVEGTCTDTVKHSAENAAGWDCSAFEGSTSSCGYYDDEDFDSRTMCCACGGGRLA